MNGKDLHNLLTAKTAKSAKKRQLLLNPHIFNFSLAPHLQFYLTVFAVSQFIPDRTPRTFLLPTYLNTKGSNIHSDVTKINNLGPEGPVTVETDRQR